MFFKKFFIAELQEINKIIETVKYADKLGMSSFDVGLSLLLDAAEIIIVICIVIGLFKKKKNKIYRQEHRYSCIPLVSITSVVCGF